MAEALSALKYHYLMLESIDGSKRVDLTNAVQSTDYFEDILEPTVSMTLQILTNINLVSELPIRGGERVAMSYETASGTFTFGTEDGEGDDDNSLYVYKVSNLSAQGQSETFTLNLVSKAFISNETSRCYKKYSEDNTIDTHVKSILTDQLKISEDNISEIEKTSNRFGFYGNSKKPFHIFQWLSPKALSASGVKGTSGEDGTKNGKAKGTAGFLFFENKDGFNFRSIDKMVVDTTTKDVGSNKKKKEKKDDDDEKKKIPKYFWTSLGSVEHNKLENNLRILKWKLDKNIDLRKALTVGMYSNRSVFYNMRSHRVSVHDYNLKEQLSTKLGGNELSVPIDNMSRQVVRTSDHGVTSDDVNKTSGRDIADMAKSFARYNLLFTQSLNILVPCNINLKVGDIIACDFPALNQGQSTEVDHEASGKYLIKELRHHFAISQSTTSLKLIRDSYGFSSPEKS